MAYERGGVEIFSCLGAVVFSATETWRHKMCLPVDVCVNTQVSALGSQR